MHPHLGGQLVRRHLHERAGCEVLPQHACAKGRVVGVLQIEMQSAVLGAVVLACVACSAEGSDLSCLHRSGSLGDMRSCCLCARRCSSSSVLGILQVEAQ